MSTTPPPFLWSLQPPPASREAWLEQRAHHHVCDPRGEITRWSCPGGSKLADIAGLGYKSRGTLRKELDGERTESVPPAAFVEHGIRYEQYAHALYAEHIRRQAPTLLVLPGDKTVRYECREFADLAQTPQFVATIDGSVVAPGGPILHITEYKCPAMRDEYTIDSWKDNYPFGIHPSYLPQLELYLRTYDVMHGKLVFFFAHTHVVHGLCALPIHEFIEKLRDDAIYDTLFSHMRVLSYTRCDAFWRYLCEQVSHFYSCLINGESLGKQPSKKATLAQVTGMLRLHEIEVVGRETEAAPHGQTEPAVEQEHGMNTDS